MLERAAPLPPLGTYLRPVGMLPYQYCLRVVQQFLPGPADDWAPGVEVERWGVAEGRPVDDGHVARGGYLDLLPSTIPDVWKERCKALGWPALWAEPVYYRRMPTGGDGQTDLFA